MKRIIKTAICMLYLMVLAHGSDEIALITTWLDSLQKLPVGEERKFREVRDYKFRRAPFIFDGKIKRLAEQQYLIDYESNSLTDIYVEGNALYTLEGDEKKKVSVEEDQVLSALLQILTGTNFSFEKNFHLVVQENDESTKKFSFVPKESHFFIQKISIAGHGRKIQSVSLLTKGGNTRTFLLDV